MEIQQLRHLVAVARHGNFSKAALHTDATQPGLSRSIKALEASLGVPLFVRNSQSVALTKHGRFLLGRAERILADLDRAADDVLTV